MHWLKDASELYSDKLAIIYGNETITFNELYINATKIAINLKKLMHHRIAVQVKNTLEDVYLLFGAMIAQIELVMINKHLTEHEIKRQLESLSLKDCITSEEYTLFNVINKSELINHALGNQFIEIQYHNASDDIYSIMFTSGTTGVQKAVPQTYGNHFASSHNCKKTFSYSHDSVWLNVLPIYHISGLSILLRGIIDGCTVVLHEQFNEHLVIHDINRYQVTHLSLVPQTLERLLNAGLTKSSLKGLLIGGAKLDDRTRNICHEKQLPIYTSFGMTETCSQMITATPNDILQHPESVGRVDQQIQLFNLKDGIGEIGVKGDNVMKGYLYPESVNQDTFINGYFLTGDIGFIKDDYLYILDRRKDLIISGGENIYPSEIEQLLLNHCEINAICIIGIPDKKWGSVPVCLYESDDDMTDELKKVVHQYLAKYKHPKHWMQVESIIRTSNGKISRQKNKDWYLNEMFRT